MAKRVLIVDDDPAQRRILEETLKRLGFETRSAASGEQALQILESGDRSSIHLVLLDLVMPEPGGMAVLERLQGKPGMPPIIVQTAHGSIDAAINAMRLGASRLRHQAGEPGAPGSLDPLSAQDRSTGRRDHAHQEDGRRHARPSTT